MSSSIVPWIALGGALFSSIVGALFAGADTALTSLSGARLEALLDQAQGPTKAALERIQQQDEKLRSRYLLGRVAATAVSAVAAYELFAPLVPGAAAYLALGATVLLTSVLFEISTTLARKHADKAAPAAARWLRPLEMAFVPLAVPLGWLGKLVQGKEQPVDRKVAEAEMEALVDEGERSGLFAREPAEMIRNVLEFAERTAGDVMVPRDRVDAIALSMPLEDVLQKVTESGHSRYPVYDGQIDNVVGLLYAKDLFRLVHWDPAAHTPTGHLVKEDVPKTIESLVRSPANFVAESQRLSALLKEMRMRREHLAIVVDEFGGVSGIVTLEDVLEEIVGDIRDEHDDAGIEDLGDGRLVADAAVTMRDLGAYLGTDMTPEGGDDSLGGMLTQHLGKVPEAGTAVSKFGVRFIVRDADEDGVGKIEIVVPRPRTASA